jgi:[acyl-carrier-protein] S-malonyltransferase
MKIAFIFPGQGAQYVGMGQDIYEASPDARRIFDEADNVLGIGLKKLCFEGPLETLTRTENCQLAVFTVSIAFLAALRAARPDLAPSYVAGLSLGEYAALVAAEIIGFRDGLNLVRKRGEFMEDAARKNPGSMSCVLGLDLEVVRLICRETGCEVANLNCPGQVVISGKKNSLEAAAARAIEKGAKRVIPLDVSGAFHSSHMNTAAELLRGCIDRVGFEKASIPLVSNVDAWPQTDPATIKENLIKQVNAATFWETSMRYLIDHGVTVFYEIGPGTVLKGLMKKIDSKALVINVGKVADMEVVKAYNTEVV